MVETRWLLDTSVLLRIFVEDDPRSESIRTAVDNLIQNGEELCFTPQIARESWAVLTRPTDVGGFGLGPADAARFVDKAMSAFTFLPDTGDIFTSWLALAESSHVSGRQVHDAYHVAAMKVHGLAHVLTLDDRDFRRYTQISVVHPKDLLVG